MKTDEIERLLGHLRAFRGVHSIDTLPTPPPEGLIVCNLDCSHRPGSHWVAIYIAASVEQAEFFDSLGERPPKLLESYLDRWLKQWSFNNRQIQSVISDVCGFYCVYFCILRAKNITMHAIVASFSSDTAFNDEYIRAFVCKTINAL